MHVRKSALNAADVQRNLGSALPDALFVGFQVHYNAINSQESCLMRTHSSAVK